MPETSFDINIRAQEQTQALERTNRQLAGLADQMTQMAEAAGIAEQQQDRWNAAMRNLSPAALVALQSNMQRLQASARAAGRDTTELGQRLAEVGARMRQMDFSSSTLGRWTEQIRDAAAEVPVLGRLIPLLTNPLTALAAGFAAVLTKGISFNSVLEQAQLALAAVFTQFDKDGSIGGFSGGMDVAAEAIRELQKAAIDSPATFEEMLEGFQGTAAAAASASMSIRQHIALITTMSTAIKGMGIQGAGQLQQEMNSLLTGDIDMNAQAAKRLGITKQQIDLAREQGKLYEFLTDKFKGFAEAGERQGETLNGMLSRTSDIFTQLAANFSRPIFDALHQPLSGLNNLLESVGQVLGLVGTNAEETSGKLDKAGPALTKVKVVARDLVTGMAQLKEQAQTASMQQPVSEADRLAAAYARAEQAAKDLWLADERVKDAMLGSQLTDLQGKEDTAIRAARDRGATPEEEAAIRAGYNVQRTNLRTARDEEKATGELQLKNRKQDEVELAIKRDQDNLAAIEAKESQAQAAAAAAEEKARVLTGSKQYNPALAEGLGKQKEDALKVFTRGYAGEIHQFMTKNAPELMTSGTGTVFDGTFSTEATEQVKKRLEEEQKVLVEATGTRIVANKAKAEADKARAQYNETVASQMKEHTVAEKDVQAAEIAQKTTQTAGKQAMDTAVDDKTRADKALERRKAHDKAEFEMGEMRKDLALPTGSDAGRIEKINQLQKLEEEAIKRDNLNLEERDRKLRALWADRHREETMRNRTLEKDRLRGIIGSTDSTPEKVTQAKQDLEAMELADKKVGSTKPEQLSRQEQIAAQQLQNEKDTAGGKKPGRADVDSGVLDSMPITDNTGGQRRTRRMTESEQTTLREAVQQRVRSEKGRLADFEIAQIVDQEIAKQFGAQETGVAKQQQTIAEKNAGVKGEKGIRSWAEGPRGATTPAAQPSAPTAPAPAKAPTPAPVAPDDADAVKAGFATGGALVYTGQTRLQVAGQALPSERDAADSGAFRSRSAGLRYAPDPFEKKPDTHASVEDETQRVQGAIAGASVTAPDISGLADTLIASFDVALDRVAQDLTVKMEKQARDLEAKIRQWSQNRGSVG